MRFYVKLCPSLLLLLLPPPVAWKPSSKIIHLSGGESLKAWRNYLHSRKEKCLVKILTWIFEYLAEQKTVLLILYLEYFRIESLNTSVYTEPSELVPQLFCYFPMSCC